jgi:hypothetical protein
VAADELTKALLLEEVAAPRAIADALFASVTGGVPLLQALVDSGAASPDVVARYLGRSEAPFLRQVVPVLELVERLPRGLCKRLLALPVRHDAITGTVDVVVADTADPHPANEIGFHLGTPVRLVRAPMSAIEEALRRLRMSSSRDHLPAATPSAGERFNEPTSDKSLAARPNAVAPERRVPPRRGLVVDTDSVPPPAPAQATRTQTPPWGTPVHVIGPQQARPASDPPKSGYGSEIPIPLTRKTFYPGTTSGGTQRPPAFIEPGGAGLGEGYAFDTAGLRDVVEKTAAPRITSTAPAALGRHSTPARQPIGSFIPGPPSLPGESGLAAYAGVKPTLGSKSSHLSVPELSGVLAALRNASSRDEILDLVLTGARMVALKVALFVVKKGGYLGWVGTSEFADRAALQSVLIPLDASSIFDRAVREDLYLGPIRYDDVHAPLLRVIKNPSRDVAAVPIRVSGKTAVIILADELGDTMIGTRRLEELARAAGDAFARIVRTRR